jgi:hypothetical protein
MSAHEKASLPTTSAAIVAAVFMACAFSGCSAGERSSSPTSGPNTVTRAQSDAGVRNLPSVGEVVVRQEPQQGTVIRDRATGGKRFFLSGTQAGECLSFLKANPGAAARDVHAACPGQVVVAMVQKQIASQRRKKHH